MNPYLPLPHGLKNCNPLNIPRTQQKFQGVSEQQRDRFIFTFDSNVYGYRAAFIIIRNHMQKGKFTINDIIKALDPKTESLKNFIAQVSSMSRIPQYVNVNWRDEETMVALVHSMAILQNGMKFLEYILEDEIRQGYHLAFG